MKSKSDLGSCLRLFRMLSWQGRMKDRFQDFDYNLTFPEVDLGIDSIRSLISKSYIPFF
ncbi:hypothetical protein [Leptospira sp. Fiocruz LV4135]|uniref:hypothetical protein n=1 Tax=Leptospira sp. Fiocruz LV4135 TaxID=1193013 RepID=UPI0018DD88A3|nr:hypothetical protein [Leptospira sp. Fiocruz LV4135]